MSNQDLKHFSKIDLLGFAAHEIFEKTSVNTSVIHQCLKHQPQQQPQKNRNQERGGRRPKAPISGPPVGAGGARSGGSGLREPPRKASTPEICYLAVLVAGCYRRCLICTLRISCDTKEFSNATSKNLDESDGSYVKFDAPV